MPWTPPLGIPAPDFGIEEVCPAFPSPWTSEVAGFYYVDENAVGATNTANPYGYPGLPRLTIPLTLAAGSVVQLVGTHTTSYASGFTLTGTSEQPIWIRGTSDAVRPLLTQRLAVRSGSSYAVFEYLNADWEGSGGGKFEVEDAPPRIDHLVLRHCNFSGDVSGGQMLLSWGQSTFSVIWDNILANGGDWTTALDQDAHGVALGLGVDDCWIVDNTISRCSGDAVQIGAGTNGSNLASACCHRVYVGRNHCFETKQDPLWTKQATDVIFSQNRVHGGRRDNPSSNNGGMGAQYGPERVWFLFNEIYDSQNGININSDSGGFGTENFIIGNVIHNIHNELAPVNLSNANETAGVGITIRGGGQHIQIVHNTISDTDAGLYHATSTVLTIERNIFAARNGALAGFDLYSDTVPAASVIRTNLFQDLAAKWPSTVYTTVAAFETAVGANATGNLEADPLLVDATNDPRLQAGSAAIDAGTEPDVYAVFLARYGLDIRADATGRLRPQGAAWDLGAYEFTADVLAGKPVFGAALVAT